MAKLKFIKLPKRIANVYFTLLKLSKKIHQSTSSIAFIGKCLSQHITPKFAIVKAQFVGKEDTAEAERHVMTTHLMQHIQNLKFCTEHFEFTMIELENTCGTLFSNLLMKRICNTLREDRISSFRIKNNKISRLIIDKVVHTERMKWAPPTKNLKYKVPKKSCSPQDDLNEQPVPVINLSGIEFSKDEEEILSYGLDHSFIFKNPIY